MSRVSDTNLNPVFRQLVENSDWVCIEANGNALGRSERIEKDGVILRYFSEVGGSDQMFDARSTALVRAENNLTVVPSFKRAFSDLGLKFAGSDMDFKTVDQNFEAVRVYLGDKDSLLARLREQVELLRIGRVHGAGAVRRFTAGIRDKLFAQQMAKVDETYRQDARDQLPKYEQAIESLSRNSK
ncbi:hypothetical protein [Sphingobium baderi]|uniref:hypothetical protein n=1 Tax=Sphingobium baderi TaxID=1332080 RepID=UPI002B408073|nr:hypothetical protein [Sphingobium baderi]WRD78059.1 hypothetical protein QQ987_08215 [Sphingobium baderi]